MQERRLKPLLPSLKERKRYLVFEVISEHPFRLEQVKEAILEAERSFLGNLGIAKAGLIFLDDWKSQKGIFRVSHIELDAVRAGLCYVRKINKEDAIVRSIGVSGILRKARQSYLR